jgi:Methylamine utilisation protein MauE
MGPIALDPSLPLASRVLGCLVLGWGAILKLRHRQEFVGVVANYRLAPESFSTAVAWSVILMESLTCLCLSTLGDRVIGPAGALALLAVFTMAMGINLARGRDEIDCGCFQSLLRQRLSPALLGRNLLLMLALLPALAGSIAYQAVDVSAPWTQLQILDGLAGGVVAFVLYQAIGHILALRTSAPWPRRESI